MCGYFCIGFIDFTLKDKDLLDYIDLFSTNAKIISITKKTNKLYCVISSKYREFEKPKISYLLEKNLSSFYYLQ